MLRISFDSINKSIKFSAFIASGILAVIAWLQYVLTDSIAWNIVMWISGVVFFVMILGFLMKILKPAFIALNNWRKKNKRAGKNSIAKIFKYLLGKKTYFKIMAIIWLIILIVGLYIAVTYIRAVADVKEAYKILANFGFMILTVSVAVFTFYFSRLFKKK